MTFLVERLAQLRRHLSHLAGIAPRVSSGADLAEDQSLANDVLFSLFMVAQLVVDIAGELSTKAGKPFADYTEAVRNLAGLPGLDLDRATIHELALLPGFRNVVVHEYIGLDYGRAYDALHRLQPVEDLVRAVAALQAKDSAD